MLCVGRFKRGIYQRMKQPSLIFFFNCGHDLNIKLDSFGRQKSTWFQTTKVRHDFKRQINKPFHTSELDQSDIKSDLNVNARMRTEIDLNEFEHERGFLEGSIIFDIY